MRKITSFFALLSFIVSCIMPPHGFAQALSAVGLMPPPGTLVALSAVFTPAHLKGMVINPADPFKYDFIINRGDEPLTDGQKQAEYTKLVKYFLASLAVPDTDQWVNLSPYEKDRLIPDNFGMTEMGRDLLAQDYLLKQIAASLTNPDSALGKKFWDGVYAQAHDKFGTTDIPTDTFNKVWIIPDKAVVYEKGNTVYVLENHLKVMMESDYKAMKENAVDEPSVEDNDAVKVSKQVMREVIIPAIEKEVNEGKNFAPLRQVYSGMLLATWYKMALKESILGKLYADKGKVKGVDQDPKNNQEIYGKYVQAFKKGVFNMIKEDVDRYTQEVIPRKYFSGGTKQDYAQIVEKADKPDFSMEDKMKGDELLGVEFKPFIFLKPSAEDKNPLFTSISEELRTTPVISGEGQLAKPWVDALLRFLKESPEMRKWREALERQKNPFLNPLISPDYKYAPIYVKRNEVGPVKRFFGSTLLAMLMAAKLRALQFKRSLQGMNKPQTAVKAFKVHPMIQSKLEDLFAGARAISNATSDADKTIAESIFHANYISYRNLLLRGNLSSEEQGYPLTKKDIMAIAGSDFIQNPYESITSANLYQEVEWAKDMEERLMGSLKGFEPFGYRMSRIDAKIEAWIIAKAKSEAKEFAGSLSRYIALLESKRKDAGKGSDIWASSYEIESAYGTLWGIRSGIKVSFNVPVTDKWKWDISNPGGDVNQEKEANNAQKTSTYKGILKVLLGSGLAQGHIKTAPEGNTLTLPDELHNFLTMLVTKNPERFAQALAVLNESSSGSRDLVGALLVVTQSSPRKILDKDSLDALLTDARELLDQISVGRVGSEYKKEGKILNIISKGIKNALEVVRKEGNKKIIVSAVEARPVNFDYGQSNDENDGWNGKQRVERPDMAVLLRNIGLIPNDGTVTQDKGVGLGSTFTVTGVNFSEEQKKQWGGASEPSSQWLRKLLLTVIRTFQEATYQGEGVITFHIDDAQITTADKAALDVSGGIDFAQSNLDMQIKRDGAGVPLPVSQQDLDNIHIDGLVPVILSIQPAANVLLFTGKGMSMP